MDKLQMAHDYLLRIMKDTAFVGERDICFFVDTAWQYADAMQAESDKRAEQKRKEIREMLNAVNTFIEKEGQHFDDVLCEVDWNQAPKEYMVTGWYIFKGCAHWISDEFPCGPAPTFSFTGSHIVERPHDL